MKAAIRTLAASSILAVAALPACRAPGPMVPVTLESRPENPRADVRVEARGIPGDFVTSIWITNLSDHPFDVAPGSFVLEDVEGRPFAFAGWAYFGGPRPTPNTPRPLWPRYSMNGWIRWYSGWGAPASLLRVFLGGEEQTFRIGYPAPPPPGPR